MQDDGSVFDSGTATHSLVLHRRRPTDGAWVFGAGTCQWAFGLNANHDSPASVPPHLANPYSTRVSIDLAAPDHTIQQATINLFALMSVQPATLLPHLTRAEACEDNTPPRLDLNRVTPLEGLQGQLLFDGTASDDEGAVAAVEVSTDSGGTWHPAEPTTQAFGTWQGRFDVAAVAAPHVSAAGNVGVWADDACSRAQLIRVRAYDDCGNMMLRCFGLS